VRALGLVVVVLAAGCSKPDPEHTMMRPIPGATVERWVGALDGMCTDMVIDPIAPEAGNQIAAFDVRYRCTAAELLPDRYLQPWTGLIQLDPRQRVSRITADFTVRRASGKAVARDVLVAYGFDPTDVETALVDYATHDGEATGSIDGIQIYVNRFLLVGGDPENEPVDVMITLRLP
jgi:hypothetical protein